MGRAKGERWDMMGKLCLPCKQLFAVLKSIERSILCYHSSYIHVHPALQPLPWYRAIQAIELCTWSRSSNGRRFPT
jgi:hypothetical protein